jgi:hypothetical protein
MTPDATLPLVVLAALLLFIVGRWKGWFVRRPPRVEHADLGAQIDADFPAQHREEARALVQSVVSRARAEDREVVGRTLVKVSRGDIGKLRRGVAGCINALDKVYGMLGTPGPEAESSPAGPDPE